MDRREMISGLIVTVAVPTVGQAQPTFRQIEWILDAASGLVLGGQGTWQGQVLGGDRLRGGRLAVLRVIGTQGEDVLVAVETKRAAREPEVKQCAAIGLPSSLWQPVSGRLLVVARQGGWVVQGTLVRGGL